ncbi:helix-turn-helix domain-containing protein [bacterium]|jgi:hypothetical protein|nr:helix-turn-helix domain-containing protein [bacterium]
MEPESLITIGEAAMRLGVSRDTLRRWDKSGKLIAIRKNNIRYYLEKSIDNFLSNLNLSKIAFDWASSDKNTELPQLFYCQDSSIFQARLVKMKNVLASNPIFIDILFLLVAVTGEIGSNSFDHNLGNWPDMPGIFFGYDVEKKEIVLADRGRGLLETLKRVKPSLNNHKDALNTAFTEVLSGRSPEDRGNGLKFVKKIILENPMNLFFQSGDYYLKMSGLNFNIDIRKSKDYIRGCIAIIKF